MEFHTFGDKKNKAIILVHGIMMPWQIYEETAAHFSRDFYVVIPALDGHTPENRSDFISVSLEADKIEAYIRENLGGRLYALCGVSLGGLICTEIFRRNNIFTEHLILDSTPLAPVPKQTLSAMTNYYTDVLKKAKRHSENAVKNEIGAKDTGNFFLIADGLKEMALKTMVEALCSGVRPEGGSRDTKILSLFGTSWNEIYSGEGAEKLKKLYPKAYKKCLKGYRHGELTVFHPAEWTMYAHQLFENITL